MEVIVVFWNPTDDQRAATTIHFGVCGEPDAALLGLRDGLSIGDFFKACMIPIEQFTETFPGCIVPEGVDSWDKPLVWQRLPHDRKGLQKLADMLDTPVVVFTYYRHTDEVPRQLFRVEPSASA